MAVSLRDQILAGANEKKEWSAHPIGTFPGIISDVVQRDVNGKEVYDILVKTEKGIAKNGFFRTSHKDIKGELKEKFGSEEEATNVYIKAMTRLLRMYKDLGADIEPKLPQDQDKMEAMIYEQLGTLRDRPCTVVVKAKPNDADNPHVFINAPKGKAAHVGGGVFVGAAPSHGAFGEGGPSEVAGGFQTNLDDIPF